MIRLERPPHLFILFLDDVKSQFQSRGIRGVIPWLAASIGLASALVGASIPQGIISDGRLDVSTAVYAGFLTLNGLVIAISWSAFANIYQSMSTPGLLVLLKKNDVLTHYLYFISFVHVFQSLALIVSAGALISVLFQQLPEWLHRTMFAATIGFTAYGFRWAIGAINVMQDLVWYKAIYEADQASRPAGSNVVGIPDRKA